jgi:putative membrane protein
LTASIDPAAEPSLSRLLPRGFLGGTLMGLANLVPGISGGTMLLAAGVYPRFIGAIAEITTLRFRRDSLLLLGSVLTAALFAIVALAGPVKDFVVGYRWIAYSLFIGLTLGGVPVVWGLIRTPRPVMWSSAAGAFSVMVVVAWWQSQGAGGAGGAEASVGRMFVAGVAGASAMILPGISGGYLLLVLGVYVRILGAIEEARFALQAGDIAAIVQPATDVIIPVGLGVAVGIVLVSNAIKWLLSHHELPTLGALLGLLVGAVVGLWPFQRALAPGVGDVFKGRVMSADALARLSPGDWPNELFAPSALQVLSSLALIAVGFAVTHLFAYFGRDIDRA